MKHERKLQPDWRLSFCFWTEVDILYQTYPPPKKPRCPALPFDAPLEWNKRQIPNDIGGFLGNPVASTCIQTIESSFDIDAGFMCSNFIISGEKYSGKSSFAGILRNTIQSLIDKPCHSASLDASKFTEKAFREKLDETISRIDSSRTNAVSFLTIERFESVTPSFQQHCFVPLLAKTNVRKIIVILLVCPDIDKLAEQVKNKATKLHLYPLSTNLVREKMLITCRQERIGYTRAGLEKISEMCSFKLMPCLEMLHQVFLKQYFISDANVLKIQGTCSDIATSSSVITPPFPLSLIRMNEPLQRCLKCTLCPPCSHISLEKLFSNISRAWALYPNNGYKQSQTTSASIPNKSGNVVPSTTARRPVCLSFARRGVCANVQKLGRCRYAHPMDLHTIDTSALVSRCRVHTLPLPCFHCSNVEQLQRDIRSSSAACESIRHELLCCRRTLADLETQRYGFVRGRKKIDGRGAKKAAEVQLARMDEALHSTKSRIQRLEADFSSRQEALAILKDAAAHGRSRGLGKGNGRVETKQEKYVQHNNTAAVAAV